MVHGIIFVILLINGAQAATCAAPDKCQALGTTAGSSLLSGMTAATKMTPNVPGQAQGLGSATGSCNANFQSAAQQCGTIKNECKQCGTQSQQKACESKIDSMIAQYEAQAGSCAGNALDSGKTQSASNTTGSSQIGQVLGALAGAAALLAKSQEKSSDTTATSATGALTTAGLNCAAEDGFRYTACDATLIPYCSYGSTAAATTTTTAGVTTVNSSSSLTPDGTICQAFIGRYCASTTSAGSSTTIDNVNFYTIDATGTGLGSTFCTNWTAANYCSVAGRESCPSCQNLVNATSAICAADPASCLATNSPSVLAAAQTSCPTDPAFATATTTATTSGPGGEAVTTMSLANVTSDVGGQYGPSVFALTQQAIANKCADRKLNCPK